MKLLKIMPSTVADFFETRARHARKARQDALLRRELSRLPRYVADDIREAIDQQRSVNFLD
ncbi:hypothetical protein IHQ71_14090 [Rhizobium sp. TH2]|uniref:hypothetical protein n=1 Tax=Rhizobium sp. TH2 TaxID=2775403 RepID=UPI0021584262|nr:hypothetical protein [Rhizobium sp. TH2]UVC11612.1 hypothetical protein IHQ71_14090 [Rhizobium sp. TH2]